jgi:hypothetical protein
VDFQKLLRTFRNLKYQEFSKINSIKTYAFSTLSTTIPHDKSKFKIVCLSDFSTKFGNDNFVVGLDHYCRASFD